MCLVAQLCPTLCNLMDCSPSGSSVHGDSPGKNTGVGCHFLLQRSCQPRLRTLVSHCRTLCLPSQQLFLHWQWGEMSPGRWNDSSQESVSRRETLRCSPETITILLISYACVLSCFSCVQLFVTSWTIAHQAPLSVGFSRQEYWGGLSCPPPGNLPDLGIKPESFTCPALAGGLLTTSTTWETLISYTLMQNKMFKRKK